MLKQTLDRALVVTVICAFVLVFTAIPLTAQSDILSLDIASLRQKAEAGEVAAQVELGDRYYTGKGGVARDYTQSWTWYQKAADNGSAAAEDMIGVSYLSGTGAKQNYAQARAWFQKAADAGYAPAQSNLGFFYERGLGGAQDFAQARFWYQQASDQGYAPAKRSLAALDLQKMSVSSSAGSTPSVTGSSQGSGIKNTSNAQDPASANATSIPVDVRLTKADSRILSAEEMSAVRDSLRWEPESASFSSGGTAESYLVDKDQRRLGSIRVQWTKTTVSNGTASQSGGPAVGSFTVEMENGTSCGFLGQAELIDPKGSAIVSSVDLDGWVGLNQPGSGQTIRVEGEANLPNPNTKIVLRPLSVASTLSACMTPKSPLAPVIQTVPLTGKHLLA